MFAASRCSWPFFYGGACLWTVLRSSPFSSYGSLVCPSHDCEPRACSCSMSIHRDAQKGIMSLSQSSHIRAIYLQSWDVNVPVAGTGQIWPWHYSIEKLIQMFPWSSTNGPVNWIETLPRLYRWLFPSAWEPRNFWQVSNQREQHDAIHGYSMCFYSTTKEIVWDGTLTGANSMSRYHMISYIAGLGLEVFSAAPNWRIIGHWASGMEPAFNPESS